MSFKQITKILLITLLISSAVSAKLGFNLGARGGLSSSWLIGNEFDYWYKDIRDADSYENMKSFSAALVAEFEILPLLSAQTEIGYIRKGITLLQSETNAKVDWQLDNLEWTVLAEFTPRGLGIFRPTFYAGPSVCFIIREKWQVYRDGELQLDITNVNDLETDLILNLGISPKIDAGFGYFFVDFRYSFGVSNIGLETVEIKDYGTVLSVEKRQLEIINSNILLSAGFSVKIKRFKKT